MNQVSTFEVRSCYGGVGDTIEIDVPETWSDKQRVELTKKIHLGLGGQLSEMRNYYDYLVNDSHHLCPVCTGCWAIFLQEGKIMVMNCNDPMSDDLNQRMLDGC
ncbi:hypothetical protein COT12_00750 [Candidatus Berkelbacteria bacterium CG08_land_8_20_14_0_20_39_8]|uniref:Uncharacterized protein n=1 Tax=Candidatus Berkelbacteria bacterium CG08_land_8_20_14_0_20_39_8 TaxID=1974511 RepID=A0A2M6YCS2_9BACT|nr:MAG: hypothetical protein COT12_00750 [Candidatus Berkelbacteria bacterium CG08_land_8_20_14_0_20_39_8]